MTARYAELGRTLAAVGGGSEANPYGEWVRTYASEDFWGARRRLDALLDDLARAATEAQDSSKLARVFPNYARAMELELAFFHAQAVCGGVFPRRAPMVSCVGGARRGERRGRHRRAAPARALGRAVSKGVVHSLRSQQRTG